MATTPLIITVKIEEVTPIGKFIIDAFERDIASITDKYTKYDAPLLAKLKTNYAAIRQLINPQLITGKIAKQTSDIYTTLMPLLGLLDIVEGYIHIAQDLSVAPSYFGISAVRKAKSNGDLEAIADKLKTLLQVINENKAALTAEGLKAADITALQNIQDTIVNTKAARALLEREKQSLIDNNHIAINDFWTSLLDICDKAKRVFKTTDPIKLPDYTITSLKQKVSRTLRLNGIKGKVQSNGKLIASAVVELLPLEAGRRRAHRTKTDGLYEIGSVTAGPYLVNVSAKNYQTLTQNITIENGVLLEQDFELIG
ncbi:MAG: carboxypeptidase-like regulatory domain-containing protein [Flavobacterium sp.]|nr:carboxypeptidase-like regulatory domain-containing protein [Flavobacterium sp.]